MPNEFKSKRATLWVGSIAVLVLGFLVAAIVLPGTAPTPGTGGPDIQVPKMQNVPSAGAPKMRLEVEKEPGDGK